MWIYVFICGSRSLELGFLGHTVIHLIKRSFQPQGLFVVLMNGPMQKKKKKKTEGRELSQHGLHLSSTFPRSYLLVVDY